MSTASQMEMVTFQKILHMKSIQSMVLVIVQHFRWESVVLKE